MSESPSAYVRYRADGVDLIDWIGSPFGPGKTPLLPAAADDDDPDMVLPPDEQAGLDALCAAVTEEIGDDGLWHGASDLQWIIESALWQAARLIRTGQPLTLPNLGRFERVRRAPPRTLPEACASNWAIDYQPDDMLLEDAL